MSKKILVYATKRSGHHAFIESVTNSMISHGLSFLYQNNGYFVNEKLAYREIVKESSSKSQHEVTVSSFENKEGSFLSEVESQIDADNIILFLRDFPNSFSSVVTMVKQGKIPKSAIKNFINCWVYLAKRQMSSEDRDINVVFNHFFFDSQYRAKFFEILDLNDSGIPHHLSRFGGGGNTAFGSDSFQVDKAVLESRWESIKWEPSLSELLKKDTALVDVAERWSEAFDCKTIWKRFSQAMNI